MIDITEKYQESLTALNERIRKVVLQQESKYNSKEDYIMLLNSQLQLEQEKLGLLKAHRRLIEYII